MTDMHLTPPTSASAAERFARNIHNRDGRARIRRNPKSPCIPLMDSALASAFGSLIAIEQDVLALVYFGDQDQQQIARQLRIPAATVATAVAHGLQTLALNLAAPPSTVVSAPPRSATLRA
ncbi:MAG: sigma factor-like helix-turn-helix DNA-binding protein [Actinomycetota bacterium]